MYSSHEAHVLTPLMAPSPALALRQTGLSFLSVTSPKKQKQHCVVLLLRSATTRQMAPIFGLVPRINPGPFEQPGMPLTFSF